MHAKTHPLGATAEPTFAELFTPKLVTVLRDGYGARGLRADVVAGLTVAIVALPLSMAIAAIIGGFLISLFGGSRFQIGGPAGAFIVLVAATVERHGVDGLILATAMAGVFMIAGGFLRLGTYIKLIPYPVTVGFTAGIAVIITASQIKDLFGLTLAGKEPGELIHKLQVLGAAAGTVNPMAVLLSFGTIGIIVLLRRARPKWPGLLISVMAATAVAYLFAMPVGTIGSRFGAIPSMLPAPALPDVSLARMQALLPDAFAFALLGSIESLLSAVVADGMTGRRHRSNCELVAQGIGNIGSALFGGICVTGTIARTATNVRAGARGPIAGILHSLFLLLFLAVAAPLAAFIPLAALAGVLAVVAWNMAEKREFAALLKSSRGDALVLLTTFGLTVFRDLTEAILAGFFIGAIIFINRMSKEITVETQAPLIVEDQSDGAADERTTYEADLASDPDLVVYRIRGAFFFGAASSVGALLDKITDQRKAFVLDLSAVPFMDSTAANTVHGTARQAARNGVRMFITGAKPSVRKALLLHGVHATSVEYRATIDDALAEIRSERDDPRGAAAPIPVPAAQ
ncbi:MAG: SulP family inorganic anion transporter [Rhizobiales bacterium]|nr:SulP family inorganic anion transporter [Hyphomicrobiales bacterium]